MFKIISDQNQPIPEGYRNLTDEEIIKDFLKMDMNKDYSISKNEWMLTFIKLLVNDIETLEAEGPDSIMDRIQDLSDEFELYDRDDDKYLDIDEYKNVITNNVYISE